MANTSENPLTGILATLKQAMAEMWQIDESSLSGMAMMVSLMPMLSSLLQNEVVMKALVGGVCDSPEVIKAINAYDDLMFKGEMKQVMVTAIKSSLSGGSKR